VASLEYTNRTVDKRVQWPTHNNGVAADNYGVSKGFEIIPANRWEVILAIPPYLVDNPDSAQNGFGDSQFLVKYRILSSNEESGNYILTAFFQMTVPTGNVRTIGRSIPWNNTLQYHLWKKFWPQTEVNFTRYYLRPHGGNTSVYLTPGIVLGRFHLWHRLAFSVGGRYEIAVTSFHPTNHIAICSVRFPF
jgi:hypothetical protein